MSFSHRTSNKAVVGISSRCSEKNLQWLMYFIRERFRDVVSDVKYLPITNTNRHEWEDKVRRCSAGILYHSKHQGRINIVNVDGALYDEELLAMSRLLGKSKVLVVLDDLEDCSDSESKRILDAQPNLRAQSSQLLLFPEERKAEGAHGKIEEFIKILGNNEAAADLPSSTAKSAGGWKFPNLSEFSLFSSDNSSKTSSYSKQNNHPKETAEIRRPIKPGLRISIFSRSAESNYKWLMEWLQSTRTAGPAEVQGVHITNNSTKFYSELRSCSFAILYHTQNQGRLNITDVTDSLYDEELAALSQRLGRENVIVVIDDVKTTSSAEKSRILTSQPSIGIQAKDLFLFNDKKKDNESLEKIRQILSTKPRNNEIMAPDYGRADVKGKSNNSSKSAISVEQEDSQDRVDYESRERTTTPGRSRTTHSEERNVSGARGRTWRGADDSGEPENKKIVLDPRILPTDSSVPVAEMNSTFQDVLSCSSLLHQKISAANAEGQRIMDQIMQRHKRETEGLQSRNNDLLKKMRENEDKNLELYRTVQEKELTIEKLQKDLRDKDRTIEENHETIKRIPELQEKLREKDLQIDEMQLRKETQHTVEKLQKDLRDKDRNIAENHETIQRMEQRIPELQEKLREKDLQIDEMQLRKETQPTVEKLQKDLRDKDRTIAENHETIQRMEQKILQLQKQIHEMENKPKQEQTEQSRGTGGDERCEGRSAKPGQGGDQVTQREHTTSDWDRKKGQKMDEGFLLDRSDRMNNHWPNPPETQSLTPADDLIEQLKATIQRQDHEIQSLTARTQELESQVKDSATVINEILDQSESRKKDAKR
ncbi:uncharacterized protein LOC142656708 [Rhinoderma darwinii]|uniref:uncharacterized protein LOC142656708 n=1 Tax=Rhinoderma darwinii TaxID=43563 RepID=UPI003F67353A